MSVDPHEEFRKPGVLNRPGFGPVETKDVKNEGGLHGSIPQVWKARRSLTVDELIAAADMCLTFVTEDAIAHDGTVSDLAQLELTRARWYLAAAELKRMRPVPVPVPIHEDGLFPGYVKDDLPLVTGHIHAPEVDKTNPANRPSHAARRAGRPIRDNPQA